jgi:hypothetical protein
LQFSCTQKVDTVDAATLRLPFNGVIKHLTDYHE